MQDSISTEETLRSADVIIKHVHQSANEIYMKGYIILGPGPGN